MKRTRTTLTKISAKRKMVMSAAIFKLRLYKQYVRKIKTAGNGKVSDGRSTI